MPHAHPYRVLLLSAAALVVAATGISGLTVGSAAAKSKPGKAVSRHRKRHASTAAADSSATATGKSSATAVASAPPDTLAHPVAVAQRPTASTDSLPTGKAGELTIIEMSDVRRIMARRAAIILDARSPERFADGHIPGARNLYVDQFENFYPELEPLLDKGGRIVVYCDGVDCPMAHELGYRLIPLGYTNILYYQKGWDEWEATKQPREPEATNH